MYVDAVSIFTAPRLVASSIDWIVPGGNYRGRGVWVRYTNGSSQFSGITEGVLTPPPAISASPTSLIFLAEANGIQPAPQVMKVSRVGCTPFAWQASDDAA